MSKILNKLTQTAAGLLVNFIAVLPMGIVLANKYSALFLPLDYLFAIPFLIIGFIMILSAWLE